VDENAKLEVPEVEERGDVPPISPRAEEREGKEMNPDFKTRPGLLRYANPGLTGLGSPCCVMKNGSKLSRLAHTGRCFHRFTYNQAAKSG
jgi:hypothetical protein